MNRVGLVAGTPPLQSLLLDTVELREENEA